MMRLKFILSVCLLLVSLHGAERIKAVGAVAKANVKALGAVAEANIKAFGPVDNTSSGGAGVVATDNFNRANGALGANWTIQLGSSLAIVSNEAVTSTLSADNFAVWAGAGTFTDNQYSKVTVSGLNAAAAIVTVRATGSAGTTTCYWARQDGIHKFVNNSYSAVQAGGITLAEGDVLELRVTGANPATLQRYVNGVSQGSPGSDSDIDSGGKPGFGHYATGSSGESDDWEGGNL